MYLQASDRIVPMVMRTAAMPEQAKKTHKLMEHPILGHTSQMWEFFLQELKDIADVADLFPETRTAVELALAMRDDAVNMLGRDEVVDAKVATSLLTVLYFLNIRPGTEIPEGAYGDILADVARIRAIIQGVHGASPGLRLVEKTDYYGWLVMFMLANAVNKAFSEMSDKSWLESNLLLDSALRVCRNIYGHIFSDVVIFINGGELGGATTASWHAHLLETLNESYLRTLPARGESHLITQDDFARLRRRPLDVHLVQDFLSDIATENFLRLGAALPKSDVPASHAPFVDRIRHLAGELANPNVDSDFVRILPKLAQRDIRNPAATGRAYISVLDFLNSGVSDYLYPTPPEPAPGKKKGGGLTMAARKALFCRHVATYTRKIAYWERNKKTITLSPATEILSGALLARLGEMGLKGQIETVLRESPHVPDDLKIDVQIVSDIRSRSGAGVVPEIRFTADAHLWSLYGKEVFAVAEQSLNAWWGRVFDLAADYIKHEKTLSTAPEERRQRLAQLDELFGLSKYFSMLKWRNIPFEREPGALNYAAGRYARLEDIEQAVENYLEYFIACFARSARHSKKSGLHKRTLCPRTTTIKLERHGAQDLRHTIIRPMPAYKPLMPAAAFNTLLGPVALLAEANARFEVVELAGRRWVVQKMGGEDVLFQRDKRQHHHGARYLRQQAERDFISGINQTMKTAMMDESCLGAVDDLYCLYYIREHCAGTGANFRAVVKAMNTSPDAEPVTQALAYAGREMDKVRRRHQDREHGFLHYKRMEPTLRPLWTEGAFAALLDRAGLPQHKILRDHIIQIIAIRELERAPHLRRASATPDAAALGARAALLQDNLDTILYFRLAQRMVEHAFAHVVAAREGKPDPRQKKQRAILRDTRNSTFLLADTIARLLYRCVASHEQRDDLHAALRHGCLDENLFHSMLGYVVKGLTYSGYKTRDFWELEGAPETEGYIELLTERPLPRDVLDAMLARRNSDAEAVDEVSRRLSVSPQE